MKEYSVLDYKWVILVLIRPLEIYFKSVSAVSDEKWSFQCVKWNILD